MSTNRKQTSSELAALASATLRDSLASKTAKSLAASVLAQSDTAKQTGESIEDLASKVMRSKKYSDDTKSLALHRERELHG